jgi:hypothetical protein
MRASDSVLNVCVIDFWRAEQRRQTIVHVRDYEMRRCDEI